MHVPALQIASVIYAIFIALVGFVVFSQPNIAFTITVNKIIKGLYVIKEFYVIFFFYFFSFSTRITKNIFNFSILIIPLSYIKIYFY